MAWNWYTKGRRIPTLIGKDVSGRRIPGGPYTGLQAVTAAAVPALLWSTRSLWAADMAGLAMIAVLIGLTVGGGETGRQGRLRLPQPAADARRLPPPDHPASGGNPGRPQACRTRNPTGSPARSR